MAISRFDQQVQKALESVVKNDFEKAKMQFNALELNIRKEMINQNDMGKLSQIKRVRLIRAGLFNKKLKL